MEQFKKITGDILDNKIALGDIRNWEMLKLTQPSEESKEIERLVTTLYAKPGTGKPFLNLTKLKKSEYEETSYFSLNSYLLFSDIGNAAWKAAQEINRNSTIGLAGSSLLEEDKSWQIIIRNPDLTVLLNSIRFRAIGKYTSAFYISIEINSKPETLHAFINFMLECLNRKPWKSENGELDWGNFIKKTFISKKEVIEQWALLGGLPELFPDILKENNMFLCSRCKKSMESDWMFCPFCGKPLKKSYESY